MFQFMHHGLFHLRGRLHHHHDGEHGGRGPRGPRMFEGGALRHVVLQLVAEQPRHGYDVIKEIEQRAGGGYCPSPGAVYPLLAMLEDLGHVSVARQGNRKLHTITPEGRAYLEENRAMVDAVRARMPGGGHGHGASGLRQAMHALKHVAVSRTRGWTPGDPRMERVRQILQRAADDIQALD